jgi:antitoxin VapB
VRRLAEMRGIGITEAIKEAVEESLAADRAQNSEPVEALRRKLQPLRDEMKAYGKSNAKIDKQFYDTLWEEEGM